MHNSSSSKPKHRHETSMDNFMKNIKKHNQRSQRYMSPPLLYMYSRNHTTNTIDKSRSRTLSNRKSSVGAVSKTKKKIDKILKSNSKKSLTERNPAYIIEQCGVKLKKIEKYLEKKNQVAHYLCQNFLKMLNEIVEKMITNLDTQLKDIENKAFRKVQKNYKQKLNQLERQNGKLTHKLKENLQKLNNNSSLIYHIRMLNNIDIDYVYGKCILGTEQCGGIGYGKAYDSQNSQNNGEYDQRYANNNIEDEKSSGVRHYQRELLQFQQNDGQNCYKQTIINRQRVIQGVEGLESGRIRPVQQWKKFQLPQRGQNQFMNEEKSENDINPFGRRLT